MIPNGLQTKQGSGKGTFGGAKRLTTNEKSDKIKRAHPKVAPRSGGYPEHSKTQ